MILKTIHSLLLVAPRSGAFLLHVEGSISAGQKAEYTAGVIEQKRWLLSEAAFFDFLQHPKECFPRVYRLKYDPGLCRDSPDQSMDIHRGEPYPSPTYPSIIRISLGLNFTLSRYFSIVSLISFSILISKYLRLSHILIPQTGMFHPSKSVPRSNPECVPPDPTAATNPAYSKPQT